ncbi:Flagellar transcriptional regulator FlhC [Enterobacter sp. DC4]|uniref:flagellar transcriptional regulator FlhC n=1 Tax=Enterobacter sp. DC4 TaxID=1395580 RepID=UPI0003ECDDE4|nr:flagellar transcriptional regulator FlhC [Enterobacter sp. DC4]EWG67297.1 Flagellar transcriptional regulator FlhC [Enterobacter sp. DC4]
MCEKSVMAEIRDAQIAMELISFGARMQVLESETKLSRRRLLKLYKELKGCSPPKGMLPFSPDWYMSWEQNIHSSIFYNIYLYLKKMAYGRPVEIMLKTYRLYLDHCLTTQDDRPVLGLTRAWTLLRFIDCGMVKHTQCSICGGSFITTPEHTHTVFTCSLCLPPSRAIKKNKIQDIPESLLSRTQ